MPNLNQKLEKLENFLEKYVKIMKEKINHYEEELKSEEISNEQQTEFQSRKKELGDKIEKVKPYLAQLYLDKGKNLGKEETSNKGKITGTLSGIGAGAASGAAAGAGAMVLLSPYTFGLSLSFVPVAATVGAVAGGLGGGTTGLAVGSVVDKFSDSEKAKARDEIKSFLEDYKTIIVEDINEVKEVEIYLEDNFNVEKIEAHIEKLV